MQETIQGHGLSRVLYAVAHKGWHGDRMVIDFRTTKTYL